MAVTVYDLTETWTLVATGVCSVTPLNFVGGTIFAGSSASDEEAIRISDRSIIQWFEDEAVKETWVRGDARASNGSTLRIETKG